MTLKERLFSRYLNLLFASPRGRAFAMAQAGEAESSDEGAVFDVLLSRVDDPELRAMVARHRDDELRHADMFRDCCARIGAPVAPIPESLQIIHRLDRALNGFMNARPDDEESAAVFVMKAYLLLQVIEERAVTQFGLLEPVMRRHDPESADVLAAVIRDEKRHLKYCRAISRRYAPDQATLERTLRHFRDIEARCFAEHGRANLGYTLDNRLIAARPWQYALWRLVCRYAPVRRDFHKTPFWDDAPAAA